MILESSEIYFNIKTINLKFLVTKTEKKEDIFLGIKNNDFENLKDKPNYDLELSSTELQDQ